VLPLSHMFIAVIIPNDPHNIESNLIDQLHLFKDIIDWCRIGGRYDGLIKGKRLYSDDGFNFGKHHELLENNMATTEEVLFKKIIPNSVIVQHKWYVQQLNEGWKVFPDEKFESGRWDSQVRKLFLQHPNHLVIGMDVHL
jgi:hypothetical protein